VLRGYRRGFGEKRAARSGLLFSADGSRSYGDIEFDVTMSARGPTAYSRSPRSGAAGDQHAERGNRCQKSRDERCRRHYLLEIVEHHQRQVTSIWCGFAAALPATLS
jgi:hypothetical protein